MLSAGWLMVALSTAVVTAAATDPPVMPFSDTNWRATQTERPASGFQLGSLSGEFESITLDEVRRQVGAGEIQHRGDAAESVYWLCYTIGTSQRLWIESDGEMGGSEHSMTGVVAQSTPRARASAQCPLLPARLQPVRLRPALWLGASESDVVKRLGKPSRREGAWRSYDYSGKSPGQCAPDGFDVTNWLLLKIKDGRVETLFAGQVTSC